jgi:hypothetical protein
MHSSAALQLVHPSAERDLAAAEIAAAAFLRALGISLDSESFHWIPKVLPAPPRGWRAATPSCSHRGPSI